MQVDGYSLDAQKDNIDFVPVFKLSRFGRNAAIATYLNNSGYKKKLRQNNTIEGFSTFFVKGALIENSGMRTKLIQRWKR